MNNFYEFIEKDIEAKKELLSCMPLNTKANKKKYGEKVDSIVDTYEDYKDAVLKYIEAKRDKLTVKSKKKNTDALLKQLHDYRYIYEFLNPINTYVEKLGLDDLLYEISNCEEFSFEHNAKIIDGFLNKFEEAKIKLTSDDFKLTCYVNEFMDEFIKTRDTKSKNIDELKDVFENIYWNDPRLVEHIELNIRQLIHKYKKDFEKYITEKQAKLMITYDIKNHEEAFTHYKEAYNNLEETKKEDIPDIIEEAKNGTIEINNYFEDSKFRISAYESLSYEVLTDKDKLDEFYESLVNLRDNLIEYASYSKFKEIYDKFRIQEVVKKDDDKSKNKDNKKKKEEDSIKIILDKINKLETELEKLNKKIYTSKNKHAFFFKKKNSPEEIKEFKFESSHLADELYDLYIEYDNELVNRLIEPLNIKSILISDVLFIVNSFNYYRKNIIEKVYKPENYEDLIIKDKELRKFINNPNNIIIKNIYCYEDNDVLGNIIKKYRFENIKLSEEEMGLDSIDTLINKINFLLRIKTIEESKTEIEHIRFIVEAEKLLK